MDTDSTQHAQDHGKKNVWATEKKIPSLLVDMCNSFPVSVFLLKYDLDINSPTLVHVNQKACDIWRSTYNQLIGQRANSIFRVVQNKNTDEFWSKLRRKDTYVLNERFCVGNNEVFQARLVTHHFIGYGEDYYIAILSLPNEVNTVSTIQVPSAVVKALYSSKPLPLYLKDMKGEYVGYTDVIVELAGLSDSHLRGMTTQKLFDKQVARQLETQDRNTLAVEQWLAFPYITRVHNGMLRELVLYKSRVQSSDGMSRGIVGVTTEGNQDYIDNGIDAKIHRQEGFSGIQRLELTDLLDVKELQALQDAFAKATGVAVLITKADGTPITKQSNFCRLCSEVIRVSEKGRRRCFYSDSQLGKFNPNGPTVHPCYSAGLWGAGASISINGQHVASWLVGQVKNEDLDEKKILEYCNEIEVDPDEFKRAYDEINYMSLEQFNGVADLVYLLANWLSEQAYQNLLQARYIITQQNTEQSLRESQERLELATRSAGIGIWEWDSTSNQFTWDSMMHEIHGIKDVDTVDLYDAIVKHIYPEDQERVLSGINQILSSEAEFSSTYRILLKDGSIRHIAAEGKPVFDSEGRPTRVIGIDRDITSLVIAEEEQKRLEQQLRQAQKLEAVGTLAGGIAHDFNNILFAILGNSEMALDELPQSNPIHSFLVEIQRAAQRASKLIKQLLLFSRPSETSRQPVIVGDIIREVVALVRASIPATIDIEARAGREELVVLADTTELHQILLNLCTNAAQAMHSTGGRLSIGAVPHIETLVSPLHNKSYLPPGRYVKISVSDTGTGIPTDIRERIFEPFFTTRKVGEGTGMGLAVVHGLVASMEGSIRLESEAGKGTTFFIYLPLCSKKTGSTSLHKRIILPNGRNERVLLVDDEPSIAQLLTSMLVSLGYQVEPYYNPYLAIEAFEREPERYKLVMTDLTMPGLTGDDVFSHVRKCSPDIPIIITTGNRQHIPFDPTQYYDRCTVLDKPLERSTLAYAIAQLLGIEDENNINK